KLCIGQLKKYLKPGQSVFDIGSGSGILSIISVYLGAGYVHGMDIDPDAVKASFENAEANGFDRDRIEFTCGNLLDSNYIAGVSKERTGDYAKNAASDDNAGSGSNSVADNTADGQNNTVSGQNNAADRQYDIVVANILADVIMPLSAVVRPYMKKDGLFITSGIIDMKEEEVKAELLKNGFEIIDVIHMGEWVSIVCK
ncbi:MAG: 50S ribosomal protein L11 methyltransferase, partial [Eubacterium sp.]|nr:50S ribosomal protein L11 methyltransferase [Eubacterium sp.]